MEDLLRESFDIVIDKATLDVFYCQKEEDPWSPSEAVKIPVTETLQQIYRVLGRQSVQLCRFWRTTLSKAAAVNVSM